MKLHNLIAIIFGLSLGISSSVLAEPPIGRTDDSQRSGEGGRRERSVPVTPYENKGSSDMVATGNYQLRCRGGSGFYFQAVGSRMLPTGGEMKTLDLSFSPSSQSAAAVLQPGTCALVERAFYLDEVGQVRDPVRVRFETPANAQLKQTQSGSAVNRSTTAAESYPDENSIPRYLTDSDLYWNFRVTNSGEGYFIAQSHAAWKSAVSAGKKGGILTRRF